MIRFEAIIDTLVARGFPNAVELANEIEFTSFEPMIKGKTIADHFQIAADIVLKHYPSYAKRMAQQEYQEANGRIFYRQIPVEVVDMDRTVLLKKTRKREIVNNRHIVQYLLRIESKYTLNAMMKLFLQDHSTILHAIGAVRNLEFSDRHYRSTLKNIIDEYNSKK